MAAFAIIKTFMKVLMMEMEMEMVKRKSET